LPPDAPAESNAWTKVRWDERMKRWLMYFDARGRSEPFQTTLKPAGGNKDASGLVARACWMKHELHGWTKEQLTVFKNECFQRYKERGYPAIEVISTGAIRAPKKKAAPKNGNHEASATGTSASSSSAPVPASSEVKEEIKEELKEETKAEKKEKDKDTKKVKAEKHEVKEEPTSNKRVKTEQAESSKAEGGASAEQGKAPKAEAGASASSAPKRKAEEEAAAPPAVKEQKVESDSSSSCSSSSSSDSEDTTAPAAAKAAAKAAPKAVPKGSTPACIRGTQSSGKVAAKWMCRPWLRIRSQDSYQINTGKKS